MRITTFGSGLAIPNITNIPCTLPDDYEVVFPVKLTFTGFLKSAVVNPWGFYARWKSIIRLSFGKLEDHEATVMFPESDMEKRRELFNWARIQLVGHALIVGVSLYFGLWLVPGPYHTSSGIRRLAPFPLQHHPTCRTYG